jgi:hypothetical protein
MTSVTRPFPSEIFSAYFGNNADALYNSVANL